MANTTVIFKERFYYGFSKHANSFASQSKLWVFYSLEVAKAIRRRKNTRKSVGLHAMHFAKRWQADKTVLLYLQQLFQY
jgi:hypothetical protein